ncbi:MAG TPA: DNA helicase UvrD [Deltaproteobacteria bacterium]|nr:DNA helicase UvrD [Deltaproteobacteria bacterium]
MGYPIVDEEQLLLSNVRTLLDEEPYDLPPSEADIVAELLRLREEMPSAKAEDLGSLMEQFNRYHALLRQVREARERPQVDPDSPYFAHLRLREGDRSRDVFLGKATRISRGIRIVDWRHAPISRLFYAYEQGEEYEEELGGKVHVGEVAARRTVTIRRGVLERIDAPEGTFALDADEGSGWRHTRAQPARLAGGEGAALWTHPVGQASHRRLGTDLGGRGQRRDKRLPDIAGLIDAEQFALITRPSSGFVVIRGTAGSGKTTVALHRIAYLAYGDPSIDSAATLFVVFSPALREYVSHVLPALGVDHVQVRDFRSWAHDQRLRHFPRLPQRIRDDTPAGVVKLKLHPIMLRVIAEQVERVAAPATAAQALDDVISALTDRSLLDRVLHEAEVTSFSEAELHKITTWCRDRFDEVVAAMEGDTEVEAALDPEDEALLLRAWQLRIGPLRHKGGGPLRFRHVAVDEVQDFSPLEIRVLIGCLDQHESITLAGDTQQHVMQDAGFTSWAEFFGHLGLEGTAVSTLRVAYRSSQQIIRFALGLLGDLQEDEDPPLVTRSGPEVELFRFTDHGAAVAFLADALKALVRAEPLASVALLTPSAEISRIYHDGLERSEVPRLRWVVSQDFTFSPGVEITEIGSVKGLEFDYVVLVEVSASAYPDSAVSRRLLHVGATRAIHQLWLTSVGTPSPILRDAPSEEV